MSGIKQYSGYLHKAAHFLPLILFGIALVVVHHEIRLHPLAEIRDSVHHISWHALLTGIGLTAAGYFVLSGYDLLALRYTGHKVPARKVLLASLIGYAISNNTGHSWASGGSVRYRFYTAWGVPGWDVVRISIFLILTYVLGVMTLGFAGAALMPADLRGKMDNPYLVLLLMAACGAGLAVYWGLVLFWRKPVVLRNIELRLPSPLLTAGQSLVASFDMLIASLVLWVFVRGHIDMEFQTFVVIYVMAQLGGLLSQVPGGIGIFEGAFLWLTGSSIPEDQHLALVGALVLYRVCYFFLPLVAAGIGLLSFEIYERRKMLAESSKTLAGLLSGLVPHMLSLLLLLTGGVMLVSGATPSVPENMIWLHKFLPLPVIEISHLLGSLIGLLLLFLARGILLRIDAAWYGAVFLLGAAAAVSMFKGYDWREALTAGIILLLLLPSHSYFNRKSSLLAMPLSANWAAMILIVLVGSAWLGFFSYRHVDYVNDLWWQFSYKGDAPRFLRALLLVSVTALVYGLSRLFGVARAQTPETPQGGELEEARLLAEKSGSAQGFLALTGDKKLFWGADRQAFLMFDDVQKYWIVMGDPVGNRDGFSALLWKFREEADRQGAKTVFYEVGDQNLPLYLDLGLTLLKIGEDAKVRLSTFSLEGGRRENMRKGRNRFLKTGYRFGFLEGGAFETALPRLREISDVWLARKNTREKRFSLGFFDEAYLRRTPVAVIYDEAGMIKAFANVWALSDKQEVSVDLMRYDPDSPSGIMEFLFVELMLWAQQEGYVFFGLGMAPLAGLERHPLAPLWHRMGTAVFDLGDDFYNFEGLYAYKAKFDPVWQPRYLALPTGLKAPAVLLRIAALISGGVKGMFAH